MLRLHGLVTVKLQVAIFPSPSVTESVTNVSPGEYRWFPRRGSPIDGLYVEKYGVVPPVKLYPVPYTNPRKVFGSFEGVVTLLTHDRTGISLPVHQKYN